jgi:bifunctional non-homologous end joining protein LigD
MNESISLRFKQGSADKVYNVALVERDEGFVVNFAYGRYGKSLKHGTKTAEPIPYDRAKLAYDKLVKSKTAKGYTPEGSGEPFTAPQIDEERTDLYPQLLNEVTRKDLVDVIRRFGGHVAWQFKWDGERRIVKLTDDEVFGTNRRALKVPLDPKIQEDVEALREYYPGGFIIDCEDMGDRLVIFDILSVSGYDVTHDPFSQRVQYLREMEGYLYDAELDHLEIDIPRWCSHPEDLERNIDFAESEGHEGVVLRDVRAGYARGKPNSWGPCLKIKFWESITCKVRSLHDTKRSCRLSLMNEHGLFVDVGNCTVPTNYEMPSPGDLVEVKYMYAYRDGSIYQPQYKGVRTDLEPSAATMSQLKYKEDMVS